MVPIPSAAYSIDVGGVGLACLGVGSDVPWLSNGAEPAKVGVIYQAGYRPQPTDVDEGIRQAILMTVARLYANRGDGLTADFREDHFVQSLFAPYQVWV